MVPLVSGTPLGIVPRGDRRLPKEAPRWPARQFGQDIPLINVIETMTIKDIVAGRRSVVGSQHFTWSQMGGRFRVNLHVIGHMCPHSWWSGPLNIRIPGGVVGVHVNVACSIDIN